MLDADGTLPWTRVRTKYTMWTYYTYAKLLK